MLRRALAVLSAAAAIVAAGVVAPTSAGAYTTTVCNGFTPPTEANVDVGNRFVYAGYELFTPLPSGFTGVTFCFEIAGLVGYSLHVSLHPDAANPNEFAYRVALCGVPNEYDCVDVVRKTGYHTATIYVGPTDLALANLCAYVDGTPYLDCDGREFDFHLALTDAPAYRSGPCLIVQPACVGEPQVVYSQDTSKPLLSVAVLGLPPVVVDTAPGCVALPLLTCH